MEEPLITLYVIAFNQERFIREAVAAAFAQTWSPLEIILSDDCSTDRTFQIMSEMATGYTGPHTVNVHRTDRNLGIGRHINEILARAKGVLVVASAGDDVSRPDRTERLYEAWLRTNPRASLIYSNVIEVDETGKPLSCRDFAAEAHLPVGGDEVIQWSLEDHVAGRSARVHGCSFAYRREVFEEFGPLSSAVMFEDNVFNWRAEAMGGLALVRKPLVYHRNHTGQATNASGAKGLRKRLQRLIMISDSDQDTLAQNQIDTAISFRRGFISYDTYCRASTFLAERQITAEVKREMLCRSYPRRLWCAARHLRRVGSTNRPHVYFASALLPHPVLSLLIKSRDKVRQLVWKAASERE